MIGTWNNFKTALLLGALTGLLLGVGYLLGGQAALVPALIFAGILNFGAYFFSDRLALASMRAQPVSQSDDPQLYDSVKRLAERANLPMPRVYVSPAAAPNAFATGRNPAHGVVCVTAGLRKMLTKSELEGVIAHELAHIRNRDVLLATVAAVVAGAITWLTFLGLRFSGGRGRGGNPLIALALMILAPLAAAIIQMAVSRSREYQADRRGAAIAGDARGLAGALQKLQAASQRVPLPVNEAQASLFIVQPLTGRSLGKLFTTHPPVDERVRRLMELDRDGLDTV